MRRTLETHHRSLLSTLSRFNSTRWASAMTILALGIGLAIPSLLYSLSDTFSGWLNHWDGRPQMSLYLDKTAPTSASDDIRNTASSFDLVAETEFISAEQGLIDFRQITQFESALDLLQENPLPAVVVVYLKQTPNQEQITQLSQQFKALPHIEAVQYDLDWLQRLSAIDRFLRRAITLLTSLMIAGVLLLVSNTIRLEINHRHKEIDIIDQLGATKAFIRRPFLYFGALEGLFGGLAGLIITAIGRAQLHQPISELNTLYSTSNQLSSIAPSLFLALIVGSSLLGWLAARITVWRHLHLLRPS